MFNKCKIIAIVSAISMVSIPALADVQIETVQADKNSINIVVEGERVIADNFLYNDTTYVPLRRIAEMLGKKVDYVEEGNKAVISDTDTPEITQNNVATVEEKLGQSIGVERNTMNIYVNGDKVEADNFLYNDTTYVPLRKITEMFDKTVGWDQLTNTATIGKKAPSVFDGNVLGTIDGIDYTDTLYEGYKKQYSLSGYATENDSIDDMVLKQIKFDCAIINTALKNGITAGVGFENDYQNNLGNYISQNGGEEEFKKILEQNGYTYELYHYVQMLNNIYSQISAMNEFVPTKEEIQKFYDDNLNTVFAFDGVRAKHVLVMPQMDADGKATDEEWEKALATANKVYELATTGTDFDSLVAEYNMDPGMEQYPEGYTFGKGEMAPEFENACYSMKVGEISKPVKTVYGYHVIELEEKFTNYKFDDDVSAFISNELAKQKLSAYLNNIADNSVVVNK